MNWLVLLIAFGVGAGTAAAAVGRLRRVREQWGPFRRIVAAASVIPAVLSVLYVLGTLWAYTTLKEGGENGRDITIFIFGVVAIVLGISFFAGGLFAATLAERRTVR